MWAWAHLLCDKSLAKQTFHSNIVDTPWGTLAPEVRSPNTLFKGKKEKTPQGLPSVPLTEHKLSTGQPLNLCVLPFWFLCKCAGFTVCLICSETSTKCAWINYAKKRYLTYTVKCRTGNGLWESLVCGLLSLLKLKKTRSFLKGAFQCWSHTLVADTSGNFIPVFYQGKKSPTLKTI